MPSVDGVQLAVEVEESKDIFSKGVTIKVDDGVLGLASQKWRVFPSLGGDVYGAIAKAILQMISNGSRFGSAARAVDV